MKNTMAVFIGISAVWSLQAQKCPDVNIVSTLDKIEIPGNAESSFKKCTTRLNDHKQTEIVNYGEDLVRLDTFESQTTLNFNKIYASSFGIPTVQAPSQQQLNDTKALGDQLKSMTPEQQKAWAMQMAQQKNSAGAPPVQEDPTNMRLVMQAQGIVTSQMKSLNNEFSGKLIEIDKQATNEIDAIPKSDKSHCPTESTGMILCDCANKIDAVYLKKVMEVRDKFNDRKIEVYKTYEPKLKEQAAQVDNIVLKCNYGEALRTTQMKQTLLSAQSAAFANAVLVTTTCVEDIRKSGSRTYLNKYNAEKNVYDISCSR